MTVGGAVALSQARLANQVGMAVARKSLDAAKLQGQAAVSLLQQAATMQKQMVQQASLEPGKGVHLDVRA
jgi:hypothetical protein